MLTNEPGIYIIDLPNGKFYLGSTFEGIASRFKRHVNQLKNGTHDNIHLQRLYNKYGPESISCRAAMVYGGEDLRVYEQMLLDQYIDNPLCININPFAVGGAQKGRTTSWKGRTATEESKAKMRKPRNWSEEGLAVLRTKAAARRTVKHCPICGNVCRERFDPAGKFKAYAKTCGSNECKAQYRGQTP